MIVQKMQAVVQKKQVKQSLSSLFFVQLMNGTGHRRQFIAQAARLSSRAALVRSDRTFIPPDNAAAMAYWQRHINY
jgi:hypothetical protein